MAAPKVYDWWRVVWQREGAGGPIFGRARKNATPRFRHCADTHQKGWGSGGRSLSIPPTWRHKCYFPRRFYPEVYDLPTRRREIDLFPEFKKNPQR